ncbi:hypothetical protein [Streptomyces sp. NPDC060194]|uniref:hypothetical protein n=1 Tax=Streptomyces sp. NPDC060194 TaxID=3347069 RepID=UPI00365075A5
MTRRAVDAGPLLTLDVASRPADGAALLKLLTNDVPPVAAREIATGRHTSVL